MSAIHQMQAAQSAQLQSITELADKAMDGFEQVTQLNLKAWRDGWQDAADGMRKALDVHDMNNLVKFADASAMQAQAQRAMAYMQRLADIGGGMQVEFGKAMNQRIERMQQTLRESTDQSEGSTPDGHEALTTMMQDAMRFASKAFETLQVSQQQATNLMAENAKIVAAGTGQPATTATRSCRPAARRG